MKMKNKVVALILLSALVITNLTGCGSSVYAEARQKAKEVKSMDAEAYIKVVMSMTSNGEKKDVNMTTDMKMSAFLSDPFKAKMENKISLMGQGQLAESYIGLEKQVYFNYTKVNNEWIKVKICDKDAFDNARTSASLMDMNTFLEEESKVKESGEVSEDGRTFITYTGTMTKDMMKKSLESVSSDMVGEIEEEQYNQLVDSLKDIEYSIWIDKEKKEIYKIKYSIQEFMQSILKTTLENTDSNTKADSVEVPECEVTIKYTGFNNTKEFEIPEEALNAREIRVTKDEKEEKK